MPRKREKTAVPARMKAGLVAPSSVVSPEELKWGVEFLKGRGIESIVHPQCGRRHLFYAGSAEERFDAFWKMSWDDRFEVLWSARGGYGANQLLERLENATREKGIPPRKLFVGYSDSTSLLEFARVRWGWKTLHAAMPGHHGLLRLSEKDWKALDGCLSGEISSLRYPRLKFFGKKPSQPLNAEIAGGNLSLIASLIGTPWEFQLDGKILFLEEVTESLSRVDRMVGQLLSSRGARGLRGIALGSFTQCTDASPWALAPVKNLKQAIAAVNRRPMKPVVALRKVVSDAVAMKEIFRPFWEARGIPVGFGLPIGHGSAHTALPLGAKAELGADGSFRVVSW